MSEDQILDQPEEGGSEGREYVQRKMASSGKRFANLIIDVIVRYILIFVAGALISFSSDFGDGAQVLSGLLAIFTYGLIIFYPWIMESMTGKTIGKYITRTRIVKPDGSKPDTINILGRTLCRLIPFDAFSYLGDKPGWHDSIPKIYVIEDD
ncbi:MAG: RDD family protein [Cyclobacteriaceae bacterium]